MLHFSVVFYTPFYFNVYTVFSVGICVCMCVCVCVCVCVCAVNIFTCAAVRMHACMHVYIFPDVVFFSFLHVRVLLH